jgi:hypothetical protein
MQTLANVCVSEKSEGMKITLMQSGQDHYISCCFCLWTPSSMSSAFSSNHTTTYIWISNTTPLHTLFRQNIA